MTDSFHKLFAFSLANLILVLIPLISPVLVVILLLTPTKALPERHDLSFLSGLLSLQVVLAAVSLFLS